MTTEEFNETIAQQMNLCSSLLTQKQNEYAPVADKLHNFKLAAHLQQIPVKQALAGMMAKHTVSIYDMLYSDETFPIEKWEEKITDHINYLLILKAVLND